MPRNFLATLFLILLLPLCSAAAEIDDLVESLGIRESSVASRDMDGWSRPEKITVMPYGEFATEGPGSAAWFREAADGVEIDLFRPDSGADYSSLANTDVFIGWCNSQAISAANDLQYAHIFSAGMDRCLSIPGFKSLNVVTNSQKAASETIAEHGIAMMLMLTRNLHNYHKAQMNSKWIREGDETDSPPSVSVQGKTALVLGLGGIGSQSALRAHALGMRVIGTRNSSRSGPDYVDYVGLSSEMNELAAQADVVINALPLTDATRGLVGFEFFDGLKKGAYYISVGRGATTDTSALMAALESGKVNGAGLDVTDPEPLPTDHGLWRMPNVIITPHTAAVSDASSNNTLMIARENLRRYVKGEKLLNLVDLDRGY